MFDHVVLVIIFLNCITIAMERPRIEAKSPVSTHQHKQSHIWLEDQKTGKAGIDLIGIVSVACF